MIIIMRISESSIKRDGFFFPSMLSLYTQKKDRKRKGATDWGPIYMLVVIVIGAVLVMTLLKPTLKAAGGAAEGNLQEAKQIASVGFFAYSFEKTTTINNLANNLIINRNLRLTQKQPLT